MKHVKKLRVNRTNRGHGCFVALFTIPPKQQLTKKNIVDTHGCSIVLFFKKSTTNLFLNLFFNPEHKKCFAPKKFLKIYK